MPWNELFKDGWRIVGMNHYDQNGKTYLFCAMEKNKHCIKSEGTNPSQVFDDLAEQAGL